MPVGAGQAGISKQRSEKMIRCRPTDVGDTVFQVVMGWLMTTHQSMNSGHEGCCQAILFQISMTGLLKWRLYMREVLNLRRDANLRRPVYCEELPESSQYRKMKHCRYLWHMT